MSKQSFEKVDKCERQKVKELWQQVESGHEITLHQIFETPDISSALGESSIAYFPNFQEGDLRLPLDSLIFKRLLVSICEYCGCNEKPELIKPYLERDIVLPILTAPLAELKPELANLVIQYPYIGVYTFDFLRTIHRIASAPEKEALCPHCFDERRKETLGDLSKITKEKKKVDYIKKNFRSCDIS